MDLKTYFFSLPLEGREAFASQCGTSRKHLQNVAYGYKPPSTELAVAIEANSGREVTRQEMFPLTFRQKWPELAEADAAADSQPAGLA